MGIKWADIFFLRRNKNTLRWQKFFSAFDDKRTIQQFINNNRADVENTCAAQAIIWGSSICLHFALLFTNKYFIIYLAAQFYVFDGLAP